MFKRMFFALLVAAAIAMPTGAISQTATDTTATTTTTTTAPKQEMKKQEQRMMDERSERSTEVYKGQMGDEQKAEIARQRTECSKMKNRAERRACLDKLRKQEECQESMRKHKEKCPMGEETMKGKKEEMMKKGEEGMMKKGTEGATKKEVPVKKGGGY